MQWLGMVSTGLLIAGLIWQPALTLKLFWNAAIPLLPAIFLFTPILWRNVCPLATLNMAGNWSFSNKSISPGALTSIGAAGIILLFILVPARRFMLNENGMALAMVIIAVGVVAVLAGTVFDAKAGFCNSLCPVVVVEKLYGQHPLVKMKNPRCASCTLCTPKGCIDLSPQKSLMKSMGKTKGPASWLRKPYGIFAAAFPGFVLGYFMLTNVPLAEAWSVYGSIALWSAGSYLLISYLVLMLRLPVEYALPALGGLAVGLYFWFASAEIAQAFNMADTAPLVLRTAGLSITAAWLWQAMKQVREGRRKKPPSIFPPVRQTSKPVFNARRRPIAGNQRRFTSTTPF